MGVGLLLPVFTFVLGRFPTVDFEQKLGRKKKKVTEDEAGTTTGRKQHGEPDIFKWTRDVYDSKENLVTLLNNPPS